MITIDEIKADIARLEKRLLREEKRCFNTRVTIVGAKKCLTDMLDKGPDQ